MQRNTYLRMSVRFPSPACVSEGRLVRFAGTPDRKTELEQELAESDAQDASLSDRIEAELAIDAATQSGADRIHKGQDRKFWKGVWVANPLNWRGEHREAKKQKGIKKTVEQLAQEQTEQMATEIEYGGNAAVMHLNGLARKRKLTIDITESQITILEGQIQTIEQRINKLHDLQALYRVAANVTKIKAFRTDKLHAERARLQKLLSEKKEEKVKNDTQNFREVRELDTSLRSLVAQYVDTTEATGRYILQTLDDALLENARGNGVQLEQTISALADHNAAKPISKQELKLLRRIAKKLRGGVGMVVTGRRWIGQERRDNVIRYYQQQVSTRHRLNETTDMKKIMEGLRSAPIGTVLQVGNEQWVLIGKNAKGRLVLRGGSGNKSVLDTQDDGGNFRAVMRDNTGAFKHFVMRSPTLRDKSGNIRANLRDTNVIHLLVQAA